MPVVALPEDNTIRYYLKYTSGAIDHSITVRAVDGTSDAVAINRIDGWLGILSPLLYLATVIGLDKSAKGSSVRNPVAWTGRATFGADAPPDGARASMLSFTGRDANGHKTRSFAFSFKGAFPADFRLSSAENADVSAAVVYLVAETQLFCTIGGLHPTWNAYANVGVHDHIVKRLRG